MLNRQHAEKIAEKLGAEIRRKKRAHDLAIVSIDGKRIVQFGIRRGSNKDLGHDHLPHNLHLNAHNTLRLAQCDISREEWVEMMSRKGLI